MDAEDFSAEIWKPIPFADGYSVGSMGGFRADVRKAPKWGPGPRKPYTCANGYQYIRILCGGIYRKHWLHRVVAFVFHGPPPTETHQAAHSDGNPRNNRADNLRWASPTENNADKKRHGTHHFGEKLRTAKLTDDAVRFIRQSDLSGAALAAIYGVSRRTIDRARCGEGWPHIDVAPVRRRRGIYHHKPKG